MSFHPAIRSFLVPARVESRSRASLFISTLALACALPAVALAQFPLISVGPGGVSGNSGSSNPSTSADARFVAFTSTATNLVDNDTNATRDVFVRDRLAGVTSRVSVTSGGEERTGASDAAQISANGRFVVFVSAAALVPEDTHPACSFGEACTDIYVHDRDTSATTRVSVSSLGAQADGASSAPSISGDGRFVVFTSAATNLVADDTNGTPDSFLHDRLTGVTTRVTAFPGTGHQLPLGGNSARISADGATIIYTGRVLAADHPIPANCVQSTCGVTYSMNRETGARAELTSGFPPSLNFNDFPQRDTVLSLSRDGRVVVIEQHQSTLTIRVQSRRYVTIDRTTGRSTATAWQQYVAVVGALQFLSLSGDGRVVATRRGEAGVVRMMFAFTERVNGVEEVVGRTAETFAVVNQLAMDDAGYTVAFASQTNLGGAPSGGIYLYDRDTDDDLMTDQWETLFGFDINSPGDAGLDSDSDGVSNLQEYQRGSHPKATAANTRYFAEGAANAFFKTRIATLNPNATPTVVVYRFLGTSGETTSITRTLPERSRATLDLTEFAVAPENDFSTVVESDQPIVADRTMTWDAAGNGSHAETSIAAPSTTWHLAEGATHGAFDLFYLIQNPGDTTAAVQITYMRLAPNAPVVRTYDVAPHSRKTIWVDAEGPELAETDVAASITSTQPIVVERAMYASTPGEPFRAGHGGAAVTAPAERWFLAEGATGTFFDMYVLISNPGTTASNVRLTYLLPSGETFNTNHNVGPRNRLTLTVADQDPRLADTPVSIIVESTNSQPVVVERAMWWPKPQWYESHIVAGATQTGTRWALAEGQVGSDPNSSRPVDTYILIANTSATAGKATVTLFLEGDGQLEYEVPLPANSRVNFPTTGLFDPSANWKFGAVVESDGVPIVVERAMYTTANGIIWTAGTASLATRLQ